MKDYCRVHFSGLSPGIRIIIGITLLQHVVLYTQAATPSPFDGCGSGRQSILTIDELDIVLKWMPDTFKDPDDICLTELGEGSYLCRDEYSGDYSGICGGMWCRDPSSGMCTLVDVNDGVQCGNRKWCLRGQCRFSDQAVATPDSCPFGDTAMTNGFGMSCPEMISRDKKLCYDTSIEQMCCQSCQAVRTYLTGCQYGDRTDGCSRAECPLMTTDDLLSCCQTCLYIIPTEVPPTTPRSSQGTTRPDIKTSTRMPRNDTRTTEMPRSATSTTTMTTSTHTTSISPTSATRGSLPTTNRPQSTVSRLPASSSPLRTSDMTSSRPGTTTTTGASTGTSVGQTPTPSGQPGTTATTGASTGTTATQTPTTRGQPGTTTTTAASTGTAATQTPTTSGEPGTTATTAERTGTTVGQTPTTSGLLGTTATTGASTGTTATQTPTTSGQPGTTATTGASTETSPPGSSDTATSQPGAGITGSQQDAMNVVAMGTGIGVGAAVLVAVIVIVVYVVRKRMLTSQPLQNMASEDDHSIGGDSLSRLTADMNVASTTWYPSYRTFTSMD